MAVKAMLQPKPKEISGIHKLSTALCGLAMGVLLPLLQAGSPIDSEQSRQWNKVVLANGLAVSGQRSELGLKAFILICTNGANSPELVSLPASAPWKALHWDFNGKTFIVGYHMRGNTPEKTLDSFAFYNLSESRVNLIPLTDQASKGRTFFDSMVESAKPDIFPGGFPLVRASGLYGFFPDLQWSVMFVPQGRAFYRAVSLPGANSLELAIEMGQLRRQSIAKVSMAVDAPFQLLSTKGEIYIFKDDGELLLITADNLKLVTKLDELAGSDGGPPAQRYVIMNRDSDLVHFVWNGGHAVLDGKEFNQTPAPAAIQKLFENLADSVSHQP